MIGEGEHRGRVKVLDFGLAKLTRSDADTADPAANRYEGRGRRADRATEAARLGSALDA
jgi:hypothetical protein